jgi:hypothetical protein
MEQLEDLILLKIEHAGLRDGPIGLLDRVKYTVGDGEAWVYRQSNTKRRCVGARGIV